MFLAATAVQTSPYVIAACIGAIPALLTASATWYSVHKGNKENHDDNAGITSLVNVLGEQIAGFETDFKRIDTHFERVELRFDSIEDKIERHLGWHRGVAAGSLSEALIKETSNVQHFTND
jgi:hypothetical protein